MINITLFFSLKTDEFHGFSLKVTCGFMHAKTKKELTKMNFFEYPHHRSSDKYLKDTVLNPNYVIKK